MNRKQHAGVLSGSLLMLVLAAYAQTTIATGSIQGTVTDPSDQLVAGAKVTILGKATGQVIQTTSGLSGLYDSGPLFPGEYQVRVEARSFETTELELTVQIGITASGNVRLKVGPSSQIVDVVSSAVSVNLGDARVQGVLTSKQIDRLPVNGRNFLDLAQLEPGVQIQDGTNFDPTKIGYTSISFGGRFGRTARITVDGVDISDETVGTTTQDIPLGAIQEFQLGQSTIDISSDLTSSGAVNVVTRTGSNQYHGEIFYLIRDHRFGADIPHPPALAAPYQRNQFGGRLGGYLLKNRLFFFVDVERTKQDVFVPVQYAPPFQNFSGGFNSPFRETAPLGRLDWQPTKNLRLFYRFNYFSNLAEATFFASSLQPYKNKDYARTHVLGTDFSTGAFAHVIRFSSLKFENGVSDAVLGSGLPLANLGVSLSVTNGPQTGPNIIAPQTTIQSNQQIKYDGGRSLNKHFLRYGVNYNFIQALGFFSFVGVAPVITTNIAPGDSLAAAGGPFPGGAANPLNYPVEIVQVGNGQGLSTEHPGLGYPAGLIGPDHRLGLYVGDAWRIRPNILLSLGLRYVRDTGRTDSDLPPLSQLDALIPGTGGRIRQPNLNFAPQVGMTWDPTGTGKTVFRTGAGLFYENMVFNNVFFDRPPRLASGAFLQAPNACNFGQALPIAVPAGTIAIPTNLCNGPIGEAARGIAAFQASYQSLTKFNPSTPNPGYIPTLLKNGVNLPQGILAPDYQTPRSFQLNIGLEREIRPGTVLTLDYVRNVTTHPLLGVDQNHVGDARFFNKNAAQQAIAATLAQCGVSTITQGISGPCPSGNLLDNGGALRALKMSDFASNGLTSPSLDFGGVCPTSYGCAFSGVNPNSPALQLLLPIGRSVYNGLNIKLRQDVKTSWRVLREVNLQAAYSLSRFVNNGGSNGNTPPSTLSTSDQDFVVQALDNRNPLAFTGPSLLDRTHQFSFGGVLDLPVSIRAAVTSHFYTGLPVTLVVPNTGQGPGEIFRTDFTGDGTVQDLLPGTTMGSLNRSISTAELASVIRNYNQTMANQPTPAGQVLISNGLFTASQLQSLGGVTPSIPVPPEGQVGVGSLRAFDLKLSWIHRFKERWLIEPNVAFYNLLNFANFDLPPNVINGLLTGSSGSVTGTTSTNRITNRVGLGTGVFALGAPRAIEFGMRLSF